MLGSPNQEALVGVVQSHEIVTIGQVVKVGHLASWLKEEEEEGY